MQSNQRAINVINQAIEKKTKEQVDFSPGRIHEIYKVPTYTYSGATLLFAITEETGGDGFLASAYVGVDNLIDDIIIPAGAYVQSGDYAVIAINADGKAWIDRMIPNSLYSRVVNDVQRGRIGIGNGDTGDFDFGHTGQALLSSGDSDSVRWGNVASKHSDLGAVGADDHHSQQHDISGSDHTGSLSHSSLSNVGANDHHNRFHDHSDALDGVITRPVIRTYTSGDTWTKPAKLAYVIVECQGAGGGGGASSTTASNEASVGSGGGGGGYARKILHASTLPASCAVAVGSGGTGGSSGGDGGDGGDSTFSGTGITTVLGGGGLGGNGGSAGTGTSIVIGGTGGTASGGDINVHGSDGGNGHRLSIPGVSAASPTMGHVGGGAMLAGIQSPPALAVAGNNGVAYGGGGTGSAHAQSSTGHGGGTGAAGIVIVTEFYI